MKGVAAPACPICGLAASDQMPAAISPFLRERCGLPALAEAQSNLCDRCDHVFFTPFLTAEEQGRLYDGYRGAVYAHQRERLEPCCETTAHPSSDREDAYVQMRRAFYDEFHADRFGLRGLVVDAGDGEGYFGRYAYPHADVVTLPRFGEPPGVMLQDLMGAADVLMIAHTLQQSPTPTAALGRFTQWLRAGAEVWLETPVHYFGSLRASFRTGKSLAGRGARTFRPLATLNENLSHHSVGSLRRLCVRTGLVPLEFTRSGTGVLAVLARRSSDPVDFSKSPATAESDVNG